MDRPKRLSSGQPDDDVDIARWSDELNSDRSVLSDWRVQPVKRTREIEASIAGILARSECGLRSFHPWPSRAARNARHVLDNEDDMPRQTS